VRVLVVEDDARVAELLQRGLQEEGYAVDVATTGPEGLWRAGEHPYDALLLDVMLPGMDGFEVCRQLRERGCLVPVCMLTARESVVDRVRGLDVGADDYLAKPFSFEELSARIRAVVRRRGSRKAQPLRAGDLWLERATHRVWRGEHELKLSIKEFALLELFLAHPGQVLNRQQILDGAWDHAFEAGSNVVDQYVMCLRRKIDRPFQVEQLQTVRGIGYRLLEEPIALAPTG
jgi:two-component system OmpR family response regulator